MKFKKVIILLSILVLIFIIYLTTLDKKIFLVNLNDEFIIKNISNSYNNYVSDYLKEKKLLEKSVDSFELKDARTTDLILMINKNEEVLINSKNQTIKNALIKSDLLVLSIGINDIYYKLGNTSSNDMYNYIDDMLNDMDSLLKLIRQYCKEDIVFVGYYNDNSNYTDFYSYLNERIGILCNNYKIHFINIEGILNKNDFTDKYLNEIGNKKIYYKIVDIIKKDILK